MAKDKHDYMGGNKVRDGGAIDKIAKELGLSDSQKDRLRHDIENDKKGGTDNWLYAEIYSYAETMLNK
jgi:hypothetical protein